MSWLEKILTITHHPGWVTVLSSFSGTVSIMYGERRCYDYHDTSTRLRVSQERDSEIREQATRLA